MTRTPLSLPFAIALAACSDAVPQPSENNAVDTDAGSLDSDLADTDPFSVDSDDLVDPADTDDNADTAPDNADLTSLTAVVNYTWTFAGTTWCKTGIEIAGTPWLLDAPAGEFAVELTAEVFDERGEDCTWILEEPTLYLDPAVYGPGAYTRLAHADTWIHEGDMAFADAYIARAFDADDVPLGPWRVLDYMGFTGDASSGLGMVDFELGTDFFGIRPLGWTATRSWTSVESTLLAPRCETPLALEAAADATGASEAATDDLACAADPGEVDRWTFDAVEGMPMEILVAAGSGGLLADEIQLYAPAAADSEAAVGCALGAIATDGGSRFTAPSTGTYTVAVAGHCDGAERGAYQLVVTSASDTTDAPAYHLTLSTDDGPRRAEVENVVEIVENGFIITPL